MSDGFYPFDVHIQKADRNHNYRIGHNISATATFKDNHKEDVSKSLIFNSEDLVINNGVLSPKYEGSGAVEVVYMDFLRNELRKDTTMLDVKFFPFKKECLTILKGSPSFNEADSTFALKASSQIGWCYGHRELLLHHGPQYQSGGYLPDQ